MIVQQVSDQQKSERCEQSFCKKSSFTQRVKRKTFFRSKVVTCRSYQGLDVHYYHIMCPRKEEHGYIFIDIKHFKAP